MNNIVVLSGAGISAESGLKTFRDSDGLWEGYDIYEVASPIGWAKNPQLVLDFYNMRRQDVLAAFPNDAHLQLATLERKHHVTIITQNIDDLHERAGSTNVLHLHGEITKMRSVKNETKHYPYQKPIMLGDVAPDGAQLRPHIVWFGEAVPMMEKAAEIVAYADVFIVVGTSLQVYPAAGLVNYMPNDCKAYIVDKTLPEMTSNNFKKIEQIATIGIKQVVEELLSI